MLAEKKPSDENLAAVVKLRDDLNAKIGYDTDITDHDDLYKRAKELVDPEQKERKWNTPRKEYGDRSTSTESEEGCIVSRRR